MENRLYITAANCTILFGIFGSFVMIIFTFGFYSIFFLPHQFQSLSSIYRMHQLIHRCSRTNNSNIKPMLWFLLIKLSLNQYVHSHSHSHSHSHNRWIVEWLLYERTLWQVDYIKQEFSIESLRLWVEQSKSIGINQKFFRAKITSIDSPSILQVE